jgi:hypothetical protein
MQYKDVTLKNIHTLPLAGIAFYRVIPCTEIEPQHTILLESIDAEMISILNRESGPDAVYREYENDTVIRIEYENINGGIYQDIYLAERA